MWLENVAQLIIKQNIKMWRGLSNDKGDFFKKINI